MTNSRPVFTRGTPPCYGCTERYVGCHGSCERYMEAKVEYEQYKQILRDKKAEEGIYDGYLAKEVAKSRHRRGIK